MVSDMDSQIYRLIFHEGDTEKEKVKLEKVSKVKTPALAECLKPEDRDKNGKGCLNLMLETQKYEISEGISNLDWIRSENSNKQFPDRPVGLNQNIADVLEANRKSS